uniref:Acyl-CoA synthetase short-chain family member 3, mitochondrial n=1 Tax=Salmo trutta TaxID=8032 RepID=A0A674BSU7_SALTR
MRLFRPTRLSYCTFLAIPNTRSERRLILGPFNFYNSWTVTAQRELRVLSSLSTTNKQQCNRTLITNNNAYDKVFRTARDDPDQFWSEAAQNVTWFEPWGRTLDNGDAIFPKTTGTGNDLNKPLHTVDIHLDSSPKQLEPLPLLSAQVSRLAGVLVKHRVLKGDLVVIYMPMVPQAMFTMLACARIGALHSLIFRGFASKELSVRIDHTKVRARSIQNGVTPLVEKALELSSHSPSKGLIYNQPSREKVSTHLDLSLDWEEEMSTGRPRDCVSLPTSHPLYVLYTSGTTGTPNVWWAASDLGWVVGHSYICYAPLLHGNTTILYEGKPVETADVRALFRVLSEHGCSSMFPVPTAIRAIRQQDTHSAIGAQYPLTRLKSLFLAGERRDVETLNWAKRSFGVPVLDHWWQTESGSAITSSCIGLGNSLSPPAGQSGKPIPGYNVTVIDDDMQQVTPRTLGNIVGFYVTMDAGYVDEEGFLYIMSRSDDVINVAGHMPAAGALEEAMCVPVCPAAPRVVDCAVVGLEDSLKSHVPLALCVLKNDLKKSQRDVVKEMVSLVRETIGPVAAFRKLLIVRCLPKTGSGKIPHSSLANLVNGKPYTISPTIEDPDLNKYIEKMAKQELRPAGQ